MMIDNMMGREDSMPQNAEIVNEIFDTLYHISSRKTTEGYAYYIMNSAMEDLEDRYPFFSKLKVNDTRFSENEDIINLSSDINSLSTEMVCQAIRDYIEVLNRALGKNAGPFFYKEISSRISQVSNETMKSFGIDFMIMQLEYEIDKLEKRIIETTKDPQKN